MVAMMASKFRDLQARRNLRKIQEESRKAPGNLRLKIRVAEMLTKTGCVDQAVETYNQIWEEFTRQGLLRHAEALQKIIRRLKPSWNAMPATPMTDLRDSFAAALAENGSGTKSRPQSEDRVPSEDHSDHTIPFTRGLRISIRPAHAAVEAAR